MTRRRPSTVFVVNLRSEMQANIDECVAKASKGA
jgi:hypothetical protein